MFFGTGTYLKHYFVCFPDILIVFSEILIKK